jgi:hypothetical protein
MSLTAVPMSSPFLGPAVWEPVAAALEEGFGVTAVAPAPPVPAAADPAVVLAAVRDGTICCWCRTAMPGSTCRRW